MSSARKLTRIIYLMSIDMKLFLKKMQEKNFFISHLSGEKKNLFVILMDVRFLFKVSKLFLASSFERRSLFGIPSIVAVTDPEQLTYSKLHELVFQRIQRYLKHIPKGKIVRTTDELHGEDSE